MSVEKIEELLISELIKPEHFERSEVKIIELDIVGNEKLSIIGKIQT